MIVQRFLFPYFYHTVEVEVQKYHIGVGRIIKLPFMQRIVVFTGAGVSAESGLKTFRDSGGLWENHSVYEVATPEAWATNPELVLEFYNQRRLQMASCEPNKAHHAIAALEKHFDVVVITQNVDDLHERAGSSAGGSPRAAAR